MIKFIAELLQMLSDKPKMTVGQDKENVIPVFSVIQTARDCHILWVMLQCQKRWTIDSDALRQKVQLSTLRIPILTKIVFVAKARWRIQYWKLFII